MERAILCLIVVLLAGCAGEGPEKWRIRCTRSYCLDVAADYQKVHAALMAGIMTCPWGSAGISLQSEIYNGQEYTTLWPWGETARNIYGFLIDIQATGPQACRMTVYPQDGYWTRKSRGWVIEILKKKFGPQAVMGPAANP